MYYTGEELLWIAICDDERKSAREIRDILLEGELKQGDFKISMFSTGEDLLKASVSRYNLVILDMVLPGKSGREVAKEYRKRNKDGLLVFCTGKCSPTTSDFKCQPYRFTRKEQVRELRKSLLETVEEMYRRNVRNQLLVTHGKYTVPIDINKILYIEIAKNGSTIHYYDLPDIVSQMTVKEKTKELYAKLCVFGFEFPHNSYLVNCHYLKRWDTHELELINGTRLSISRSKEKSFRAACVRYIF
ncbi:MAG: LytTR family DNA-binding domain-containing protein [Lachnospiraceae bacterium]|nr:LytTR family DNA-binding domain-containing protein [Lachnospiraceae bacterium]